MKCDHPGCTGNHHTLGPTACPARVKKQAEYQSRYRGTAKGMLTEVRYEAYRRGRRYE